MIQIRNVPDDVHRELKVRAARAGMSLSDFLNAELTRLVAHRPLGELVSEFHREPALRSGGGGCCCGAGRSRQLIVVDASALIDAIDGKPGLIERLADEDIHAPHLIDVEVASALRRLVATDRLDQQRAVSRCACWSRPRSIDTLISRCYASSGRFGTGSPPTTPRMWRWPLRSVPRWLPPIAGWRLSPASPAQLRFPEATTLIERIRNEIALRRLQNTTSQYPIIFRGRSRTNAIATRTWSRNT
jgi:hypothetical protein